MTSVESKFANIKIVTSISTPIKQREKCFRQLSLIVRVQLKCNNQLSDL